MKSYVCLAICVCALLQVTESRASLEALHPKHFKPTVITNGTGTGTRTSTKTNANVKVQAKAKASPSSRSAPASPCGETLIGMKDGDHGYIESPGYPDPYKAGIECLWTLKAKPGVQIFLTVFDIRTFSDPFSDAADSVFISLLGEWEESQTQRFSGDLNAITPIQLVTQGSDLLIRFKSSQKGGNQRGFRMGYEARHKPAVSQPADNAMAAICPYIPVETPPIFPDYGESKRVSSCGKEHETVDVQAITRSNPTPYLVALVLDDSQFCSGTLIASSYVVTTAHCTSGVKKADLLFGTNDLSSMDAGVQKRSENASAISLHPGFNPKSGLNDISIIKLTEPVELTRFVRPARLPTWEVFEDRLVGVHAEISGWGDKEGNVDIRTGTVPVQVSPNTVCRASLHKGLSGMFLCVAPDPVSKRKCSVDSGSPIATRCTGNDPNATPERCGQAPNIVLGVMSFGKCERGYAFTRLAAHLDFISQVTGVKLNDFATILE